MKVGQRMELGNRESSARAAELAPIRSRRYHQGRYRLTDLNELDRSGRIVQPQKKRPSFVSFRITLFLRSEIKASVTLLSSFGVVEIGLLSHLNETSHPMRASRALTHLRPCKFN